MEQTLSEIHTMPGHLIRRLNQISTAIFSDRMAAENIKLTPVQFAALSEIEAMPGIDQATLAGAIAYDRVTLGGVVDRLEHKELVRRTISPNDRRARVLSLTANGVQLLNKARPIVKSLQNNILLGLDIKERDLFLHLLIKAIEAGNDLNLWGQNDVIINAAGGGITDSRRLVCDYHHTY